MADEPDALLKHHPAEGSASTRDAAMLERASVPSRVFVFGPESEEQLLEETILAWRAQGPAAAWDAMFDLLAWWFEARGLDPEAQRIDRSHNEIHRVPWLGSLEERGGDA
jgi:hypothetical protein